MFEDIIAIIGVIIEIGVVSVLLAIAWYNSENY
jgi:hypothetical protein